MKFISLMELIILSLTSLITFSSSKFLFVYNEKIAALICLTIGIFCFLVIYVKIYNHRKGIIKL